MFKIVLIALLVIGLVVGVYLVKNQQTTIKTKASSNITDSFEFKDANGSKINCVPNENGIPVCTTKTLEITATLKTDSF